VTAPAAVDLRGAMGRFASGVTVVTTRDAEGDLVGTTASAVSSVSLDPPLVLACLAHTSRTLAAVRQRGAFAITVLGAGQAGLARAFARTGGRGDADTLARGAQTVLDCELHALHDGGDHAIVVGHVLATRTREDDEPPLLSYRSRLGAPGTVWADAGGR
jgi:flavin reductase (DIM6/NTAB) family NADH-FMN oxidoreductase RutF